MTPKHDPQAIAQAVRLIVGPGNVCELRALDVTMNGDRFPVTLAGYFDDADKLTAATGKIGTAKGIYITLNPAKPALLARAANRIRKAPKGESTQDGDILRRCFLPIDCDPVRPSGIGSTDAEHEAAIERCRGIYAYLKGLGWPDPVAADSGNGGHLLYRVDLPTDDGGIVQRCLEALAQQFDDESVKVDRTVFNPSRIWKLYGTAVCKGDSTPDRPHRLARILNTPAQIIPVPLALLEALANQAKPADAPKPAAAHHHPGAPFDLEGFIRRNLPDAQGPEPYHGNGGDGQRWILARCPWNLAHGNGAAYILRFDSGAIAAGCLHNGCAGKTWHDLRAMFEPIKTKTTPASKTKGNAKAPAEPYRPFPVDALPHPLRVFVTVASRATGCDPAFVGLPLLVMLAGCVGTSRAVILKRGWVELAILWGTIIGESGTLKSPAFRHIMKAMNKAQHKAMMDQAQDLTKYKANLLRHKIDLAGWKEAGAAGDPPPEPQEPQARRFIVSDATVEALAPILAANPKGVLCARPELSGWVGSFDRYANGHGADAANWIAMYDGEPVSIDRKTGTQKNIYVPSAAVSVVGTIQPGIMGRAFTSEHRESGLLARLLVAMPPSAPALWTDNEIPADVEDGLARIVDALLALEPAKDQDGTPHPAILPLTDDARRRYVAWHDDHARELAQETGDLAAAFAKIKGAVARLALVIQCAREADGDPTLQHTNCIDAESVGAAIALGEWFKGEVVRVYAVLGGTEEDRARRPLLAWIARQPGPVTVRDLTRGPRQYRNDADGAELALQDMVKGGYGEWVDRPAGEKGGAPTVAFKLFGHTPGDETPLIAENGAVSSPSPPTVTPGARVGEGRTWPDGTPVMVPPDPEDLGAGCSDYPEPGGGT